MERVVINIRASKNISGLVKVSVTSPAGLMKFFLSVELCTYLFYHACFKEPCPDDTVCGLDYEAGTNTYACVPSK